MKPDDYDMGTTIGTIITEITNLKNTVEKLTDKIIILENINSQREGMNKFIKIILGGGGIIGIISIILNIIKILQ